MTAAFFLLALGYVLFDMESYLFEGPAGARNPYPSQIEAWSGIILVLCGIGSVAASIVTFFFAL